MVGKFHLVFYVSLRSDLQKITRYY